MTYKAVYVQPGVAAELAKLAAEITIKTGKRPTLSDLVMRGIKLTRENLESANPRPSESCAS